MPSALSVAEIMSCPVVAVGPAVRVGELLALANERQIHHFPIVDGAELVGFVCTCDLARAHADALVLPLAWHCPATVSPACSADQAARLLLLHGVGSLIILDQSGVRGIITCDDLRRCSQELAELLQEARCLMCGAGEHLRPGPGGNPICVRCQGARPESPK